MSRRTIVATAGWAIPRPVATRFPSEGGGLQRYAARFGGVEINSTFYRPHRASTFERWANTTPHDFRFSLKAPRSITHDARLVDCEAPLTRFLADAAPLGDKFAVVLVQAPPSLAFDRAVAEGFFAMLRRLDATRSVACEPRHPSWFGSEPDDLLRAFAIARVAADPAPHPAAVNPGGWPGLVYHRLHGSPRMYYSSYEPGRLEQIARRLARETAETWCVFDNTTSGAAAENALDLARLLAGEAAVTD